MQSKGQEAAYGRSAGSGMPRAFGLGLALILALTCVCGLGTAPARAEKGILGTIPLSSPRSVPVPRPAEEETGSIDEASLPSPVSASPDSSATPQTPATGTVPSAAGSTGAVVSSIRVGDRGAETRFVVELSGSSAVKYHVFTLADPYRVVIDFPDLPSILPENAGEKGRGVIADYRYGEFQDNTFRVVIDTTGPVSVARNFILEPQGGFGRRVVIDLAATDRASFVRSVGLPYSDKAAVAAETPKAVTPAVVPISPAARHDRRRVVVIDPGHGGVDPGTHGKSGVVEKDVVLAFGKELAKRLNATGRYEVHMTRDKDIFIPLRERVQIARRYKADLFISVHADSIAKPDVRGMSVYTLSETASDREAAELARKEKPVRCDCRYRFRGRVAGSHRHSDRPRATRDEELFGAVRQIGRRLCRAGDDAARAHASICRLRRPEGTGCPLRPGRARIPHQQHRGKAPDFVEVANFRGKFLRAGRGPLFRGIGWPRAPIKALRAADGLPETGR